MNADVASTAPVPPVPILGPFTVAIEGITPPALFERLEDALTALWGSLRLLPLGYNQASAYQLFLTGPDAVDNVLRLLKERASCVQATFQLEGETRLVTIRSSAG